MSVPPPNPNAPQQPLSSVVVPVAPRAFPQQQQQLLVQQQQQQQQQQQPQMNPALVPQQVQAVYMPVQGGLTPLKVIGMPSDVIAKKKKTSAKGKKPKKEKKPKTEKAKRKYKPRGTTSTNKKKKKKKRATPMTVELLSKPIHSEADLAARGYVGSSYILQVEEVLKTLIEHNGLLTPNIELSFNKLSRPLTPFFRYKARVTPMLKEQGTTDPVKQSVVMWKALSEEKRAAYKADYDREQAVFLSITEACPHLLKERKTGAKKAREAAKKMAKAKKIAKDNHKKHNIVAPTLIFSPAPKEPTGSTAKRLGLNKQGEIDYFGQLECRLQILERRQVKRGFAVYECKQDYIAHKVKKWSKTGIEQTLYNKKTLKFDAAWQPVAGQDFDDGYVEDETDFDEVVPSGGLLASLNSSNKSKKGSSHGGGSGKVVLSMPPCLLVEAKQNVSLTCPHCQQVFPQILEYTLHRKTHVEKKDCKPLFNCKYPGCETEAYDDATAALRHAVNAHVDKEFLCPALNCLFRHKEITEMELHLSMTHPGANFKCSHGACGWYLENPADLVRHATEHKKHDELRAAGRRPAVRAPRKSRAKLDGKSRRRKPSEIFRAHKCPIPGCTRAYGSPQALNEHVRRKHPIVNPRLPNWKERAASGEFGSMVANPATGATPATPAAAAAVTAPAVTAPAAVANVSVMQVIPAAEPRAVVMVPVPMDNSMDTTED